MIPERAWLSFFESHAEHYDRNAFTHNTQKEVNFFLSLFAILPGARVLDMGCGTGRHSLELARRGFHVTGVDLSPAMLKQAREKALSEEINVEWVEADALDFRANEPFDAAICLCEGAVGLIERGEDAEAHDSTIFRRIFEALNPGGPFLLTALNGYSTIRQMNDEHIRAGRFDPATMVSNYDDQLDLPEGPRILHITERLFIAPEMVRLLRSSGFEVLNVFGGTAGHWAQRPLSLDEVEAMYVCRKPG